MYEEWGTNICCDLFIYLYLCRVGHNPFFTNRYTICRGWAQIKTNVPYAVTYAVMPYAVVVAELSHVSAILHDRELAPAVLPLHISSPRCCPLFLVFKADILESVLPSTFRMHCLSPTFKPRAHFVVSWVTDQPTDRRTNQPNKSKPTKQNQAKSKPTKPDQTKSKPTKPK